MAEAIEKNDPSEHCDNQVSRPDWSLQLSQCFHNEKSQLTNVEKEPMSDSSFDGIPCEYCDTQISFDDWETHMNQCIKAERQRINNTTNHTADDLIPCEYCTVPISIDDWTSHTNECGQLDQQRIENIAKHAENALIPCEYCTALFTMHNLTSHMNQCTKAPRRSIEHTTEHNTDALIPCEYCDEIFAFQYIQNHQTECQRKQVLSASAFQGAAFGCAYLFPKTWDQSSPYNLSRYILKPKSEEYQFVADNFHKSLPSNVILQIERIQNRRWYRQYDAHKDDFIERYGNSTEQWLFHGCGSQSIDGIINSCFDRSRAVRYAAGQGIYFATQAATSFSYTQPDAGNIRHMFMARVLVGKTTAGDQSTRVCPAGFDTTGGNTIFVTYHDAQAYGEYLIAFR